MKPQNTRAYVKTAQHSVHVTAGSLRDLQALFSLRVYTALGLLSTPTHTQVTQSNRQLSNHGQMRAKWVFTMCYEVI